MSIHRRAQRVAASWAGRDLGDSAREPPSPPRPHPRWSLQRTRRPPPPRLRPRTPRRWPRRRAHDSERRRRHQLCDTRTPRTPRSSRAGRHSSSTSTVRGAGARGAEVARRRRLSPPLVASPLPPRPPANTTGTINDDRHRKLEAILDTAQYLQARGGRGGQGRAGRQGGCRRGAHGHAHAHPPNDPALCSPPPPPAQKICGNVCEHPHDPKYRRIRVTNPVFGRHVRDVQGGEEFLRLAGWGAKVGGWAVWGWVGGRCGGGRCGGGWGWRWGWVGGRGPRW